MTRKNKEIEYYTRYKIGKNGKITELKGAEKEDYERDKRNDKKRQGDAGHFGEIMRGEKHEKSRKG